VLDTGAGSGGNAAWLAGLGHDVVAGEPAVRPCTRLNPSLTCLLPRKRKEQQVTYWRKEPFQLRAECLQAHPAATRGTAQQPEESTMIASSVLFLNSAPCRTLSLLGLPSH
jgi:hypothetical protein